jgi:DNA-binding transcriptional LysR family regulator
MEIDPDLLDIALTLPSNEAVLAAVREGVGCAALSQRVVEAAVAARMVRILPISLPDRPFYAIRQIERYQSRAADAFLETIKPATEPGA